MSEAKAYSSPIFRLGILGGGQLAKMMAQVAQRLDMHVEILDPAENPPAKGLADAHLQASFTDAKALREIALRSDVLTFDIETIATEPLQEFAHKIFPSPDLLHLIQNKDTQKTALEKAGIPCSKKIKASEIREGHAAIYAKHLEGGYDGRGTFKVEDPFAWLKTVAVEDFLLEECIEIKKELSVMVARNSRGEIECYPIADAYFKKEDSVLDYLLVPAEIPQNIAAEVTSLAKKAIEALDGVGIFGIEFFWTQSGEVILNEISPRPHNSGHYTIEASYTSQFEQHLRAIAGLPLGDTSLREPVAMLNLLGESDGAAQVMGLEKAMKMPKTYVHVYGKEQSRLGRKMGHVSVMDQDSLSLKSKVEELRSMLHIKGR